MTETALPLAGLRVLDISSFIAAPAAAVVLGDWGADVIKIEGPDGDPNRRIMHDSSNYPKSPVNYPWQMDSRNKRSIVLDLKQADARAALDSLLQQGEGIATALLEAVGVDRAALTAEVRAAVDALPSASGSSVAAPQLSQQSYAVVNTAQELAKERGDEYVSTEHLLVALAKEPGVRERLNQAGATPDALMAALQEMRGGARVTSPDPEGTFQALEKYGVELIGQTDAVIESFYAISVERKVKHPGIVAITEGARRELFNWPAP